MDDDVAAELGKLQKARNEPFKQTVNAVLRAGLSKLNARRDTKVVSYKIEPVSLGKPRLKNLDDISEVLAFAEGEDHP